MSMLSRPVDWNGQVVCGESCLSSVSATPTSLPKKRYCYLAILEKVQTGDCKAPTPIGAVFEGCCRTWFDVSLGIYSPTKRAPK